MRVSRCWRIVPQQDCNKVHKAKTSEQLYLFSPPRSRWFLSPLPSLWVAEIGVSYCATRVLSGIHPHTAEWDPSLRALCVCGCGCVCACRTISVAQQPQEKGHKISCPHLSPDSLSMKCFSVLESGTRVCECVSVCVRVSMWACPPVDFAMLPTVSWREHDRVPVSVMIGEADKMSVCLNSLSVHSGQTKIFMSVESFYTFSLPFSASFFFLMFIRNTRHIKTLMHNKITRVKTNIPGAMVTVSCFTNQYRLQILEKGLCHAHVQIPSMAFVLSS